MGQSNCVLRCQLLLIIDTCVAVWIDGATNDNILPVIARFAALRRLRWVG
jgi:hypothetical protein